jgi:hypothetical protein
MLHAGPAASLAKPFLPIYIICNYADPDFEWLLKEEMSLSDSTKDNYSILQYDFRLIKAV